MNVSVKNPINRLPVRLGFIRIPLLLASFAVSPVAQAGPQSRPSPTPSPAPGPQDVNVVNTPTVSDADNPARQPFQASGTGVLTAAGETGNVPITTVPGGKRLIIEHVSVFCFAQTGQRIFLASIGVALQNVYNGANLNHYLTLSPQGSNGLDLDFYTASEQVRLYADPGTQVFVYAAGNPGSASGSPTTVHFAISGYLVDVP
jgi:hypothetical protein